MDPVGFLDTTMVTVPSSWLHRGAAKQEAKSFGAVTLALIEHADVNGLLFLSSECYEDTVSHCVLLTVPVLCALCRG